MTQRLYDVFISYADADREWVEGFLIPALGIPDKRIITKEKFRAGADKVVEFERAVTSSRYTLLILSQGFLTDVWAGYGGLLASYSRVVEEHNHLLPLFRENCKLPLRIESLISFDCTKETKWQQEIGRLRDLLGQPEPKLERIPCPYPGMVPFSEAQSDRFFGRNQLINKAVQCLYKHPFLTVIGPSGSGKSSLVFAGLIPELRNSELFGSGEWLVRTMRPGEEPKQALNDVLNGKLAELNWAVYELLGTQPNAQRLLLVIDQFEELFTVGREEAALFQEMLLSLVEIPKCYVVLTIRADFYPDLMESPLWQAVEPHRLEVVPLGKEGLRQAIAKPAEEVGVFVERDLVERLVSEAAGEPGILPLVQETLVLLWNKRQQRFLRLTAYEALEFSDDEDKTSGDAQPRGLHAAIALHAKATLNKLNQPQQAIARRIFLRLVQFGEGRPDTRRQQPVDALRAASDDPELFDKTLGHLAENRLLTLSGEKADSSRKVDIAHEALISGWHTLYKWLKQRQEAEQIRRRLEEKAAEWVRLGGGIGGLLDAYELLEADHWLSNRFANDLGCSQNLLDLVKDSQLAIHRDKRQARIRVIVASGLAIITLAAGGFAWQRQQQSESDQLILSAVTDGITPNNARSLARKLPDYLKKADKHRQEAQAGKEEKVKEALADYRQILSLTRKLQTFSVISQEKPKIQKIAETAEKSLVEMIRQHRLKSLRDELSKGNFGKFVEGDFSKFEKQYTGALQKTYAILLREPGVKADLNNDGYLTEGEETTLPCETLKDIEILWRDFTQGRCGWYGSNSIYDEPNCREMNGQTLTVKLSFPPSMYLLERRLSEQCKVVPVPKSASTKP